MEVYVYGRISSGDCNAQFLKPQKPVSDLLWIRKDTLGQKIQKIEKIIIINSGWSHQYSKYQAYV